MTTTSSDLDTAVYINSLYLMICTFLMLSITVGIPMFYSGLTQRRSAFTMLAVPLLVSAVIYIDWYIWGYSLCYSSANNHFIGDLDFAVLRHVIHSDGLIYNTPRGDILTIVHFLFNGFMKVTCTVLTFPACAAERGRILPMLLFVFLWSAIIYNPVNYWFWNRAGWLSPQLNKLPVLDFAGGNCIHVVSGFTALAYSYYIGPRNPKVLNDYRSSNNGFVIIGLCFLLFGWCGFISGCDFKFSVVSFYLINGTFLCAFVAGLFWSAIDYYYSAIPLGEGEEQEGLELQNLNHTDSQSLSTVKPRIRYQKRTISMVSFCSGVTCGLVVFTPAGGYVCIDGNFWKPILFGVVGGVCGNLSTRLKYFFKIDDALDIFAVHGVCGVLGSLLVGIFADDAYESKGGWVAGNWIQLGYQLLGSVVAAAYVFIMSLVFLYLVDLIPGMHLRIDKDFNRRARKAQLGAVDEESSDVGVSILHEHNEVIGTDYYELNEEYCMDFMEFIKIIDPSDFNGEEESDPHMAEGTSSGEFDETQLRKREIRPEYVPDREHI